MNLVLLLGVVFIWGCIRLSSCLHDFLQEERIGQEEGLKRKINQGVSGSFLRIYHPLGNQLENHILCNSFGSLDLCLCLCLCVCVNSIHNSIHNARERRDIQELVLHWHSRHKGTRSALPCRMSLLCSSKVSARCKKQIFSSILMQMFLFCFWVANQKFWSVFFSHPY